MKILCYAVTTLYDFDFAALSSQGFSRDLAKPIDPNFKKEQSVNGYAPCLSPSRPPITRQLNRLFLALVQPLENPSLRFPSPEWSRQQTHGYAKVFMWMAIVRDVRHYYSRVSRIPANQVVTQSGMQQSLLILGETGPTLRSRIYTKRTPCTRILLLLLL